MKTCLDRSVAMNLRHDGRIKQSRQNSFLESVSHCRRNGSKQNLEFCCQHHLWTRIRQQGEFLTDLNKDNFCTIPPTLPLITVLNLSGIFSVLQIVAEYEISDSWDHADWAVFNRSPQYPASKSGYGVWLDSRLDPKLDFEPALRAILKGLALFGRTQPYRPRWVTKLDLFKPFLTDGEKWWAVVGLAPPKEGDWLVLLAYERRDAGPLMRPTQLDAGWYGYHFPSSKTAGCGYAMEIGQSDSDEAPLEEYIHDEKAPDIQQWITAGSIPPYRVKKDTALTPQEHLTHRELHVRRLKDRYREFPLDV